MLAHGWTDFNLDLTMVFYRFFCTLGQTELKRVFLLKRLAKTGDDTLQRAQKADVFSVCLDKELLISTTPSGNIDNINQDLFDRVCIYTDSTKCRFESERKDY